jgi:hypothetical protein
MIWTLTELVGQAAQALAAADVRAPNGRVTELPDARMIRWYATIGLVDKPSGFRGRTALYGPRHLLQLVAVKRRQAEGRALAEIQAELTGATEATLRRVAGLPDGWSGAAPDVNGARSGPAQGGAPARKFWADRPAPAPERPRSPQWTDGPLHGVGLPGGAMLLVPADVRPDQIAAIRAAAQPLLDHLSAHGLLNPDEGANA